MCVKDHFILPVRAARVNEKTVTGTVPRMTQLLFSSDVTMNE